MEKLSQTTDKSKSSSEQNRLVQKWAGKLSEFFLEYRIKTASTVPFVFVSNWTIIAPIADVRFLKYEDPILGFHSKASRNS